MKKLSRILGVVLHPVILSLIAVFIISQQTSHSIETAFYWTLISGIFALIIGGFVLLGVKKGFFNNLDVSNRKQRVILYPFAISVVIIFAFLVYFTNGPEALMLGSIFFVISLAILDLVNRKIKASIHVASVSAFATGMVYLFGIYYLPVFFLVFLSAIARVVAKRHTISEVIVGGISGVILTIGGIYIVKLIGV